ncbi:MAG: MFS transporter [Gammaproteobacteria bacterium 39-13]|nr:MFS transporter [Gammaproteobacteria bacterium]OJV93078.1 MAG: MFS transporter [Gammaproteobacteria bacterium 39-13]
MRQQKKVISIWLMWSLASFFYAYQYILRVLPNIMMTDILEKFQIDASLFGQYSGLYYIGYAGMHIPVGILLDKYGPKWVLPLCMILTVIGLLPLLYADHWIYPGIGRLLIGMGSSAAILGVFKIIRMSFPEDKFTFILGCSVTIGLLGAIYGGQPVNYLMHTFGSEKVLQIIILMGVVLSIATFFAIPAQATVHSQQGWFASVKEVLTNYKILMICLFAGFMVGPLEGFADVWGKEYLKSVYKLDENVASSLPSLIFLGMCFGSPILSWITAKTKAYFGFIILSGVVMGISFILLLTGQLPVSVLTAMFIVVGVFSAYQILAIYKASTYGGENLVGLTTACANMIIMTFGYVFHSLIGKIMTHFWDGTMNMDVPVYGPHAYTFALMVIPVGLLMGALGFVWLATSKKTTPLVAESRIS